VLWEGACWVLLMRLVEVGVEEEAGASTPQILALDRKAGALSSPFARRSLRISGIFRLYFLVFPQCTCLPLLAPLFSPCLRLASTSIINTTSPQVHKATRSLSPAPFSSFAQHTTNTTRCLPSEDTIRGARCAASIERWTSSFLASHRGRLLSVRALLH